MTWPDLECLLLFSCFFFFPLLQLLLHSQHQACSRRPLWLLGHWAVESGQPPLFGALRAFLFFFFSVFFLLGVLSLNLGSKQILGSSAARLVSLRRVQWRFVSGCHSMAKQDREAQKWKNNSPHAWWFTDTPQHCKSALWFPWRPHVIQHSEKKPTNCEQGNRKYVCHPTRATIYRKYNSFVALFFQVVPTSGKITVNHFNHGTHGNKFKFIQLITHGINTDFFHAIGIGSHFEESDIIRNDWRERITVDCILGQHPIRLSQCLKI